MRVLIMEWPNRTATIMTEIGQVVWTFSSAELARSACSEWFSSMDDSNGYYELVSGNSLAENLSA